MPNEKLKKYLDKILWFIPFRNLRHLLRKILYNILEIDDLKKELTEHILEYKSELKLIHKDFYDNAIYMKITNEWYPNYTYFENDKFFRLLTNICSKYNKFLLLKYSQGDCDIEFFSVYGPKSKIIESKSKIKIFWTCEANTHIFRSEYKDNCLEYTNLSLGSNRIEHENYIRLPLWIFYFDYINLNKDNIFKKVTEINKTKHTKTKFASLIATWGGEDNLREAMYNRISKIDKVDCPSKFLHNDNSLKNEFNDNKLEYLKQFKFNICPENVIEDGYITEKLFDAFKTGCIPIWNGDKNIEPNVINKDSILYWEKDSDNRELLKEIERLHRDETYYNNFISQPRLIVDNATDYIYNQIKRLHDRLEEFIQNLIQKQ